MATEIFPGKKQYIQDGKNYKTLPVFTKIRADFDTPVSLFLKTQGEMLLESVEQEENIGRYSFITIGRKNEFIIKGKEITIKQHRKGAEKPDTEKVSIENPLDKVREYFEDKKPPVYEGMPPVYSGAIGYLGYEMIHCFESIPEKQDAPIVPDGFLITPEITLVYDFLKKNVTIIVTTFPESSPDKQYKTAAETLDKIIKQIRTPVTPPATRLPRNEQKIFSNFKKEEFMNAVKAVKQHITDGDIIQCVLSQRFEIKTGAAPFDLYRTLRILNPSPYLFFLDFKDFAVIGSSPEVMVKAQEGNLLIKPIAGTRPRGKTPQEDIKNAEELLADEKEKAEHLMLVDLGRNDLGRVSRPGTVNVREYMTIERFSHVMHIVSTITSELDPAYNVFDVIKAVFPAGTLTGAPKIRAMEIISKLEKQKRGPYGGMIVNLGFNGNLDSCITIRTMLYKDKTAYIQAGAGIVADSEPENEYEETVNKAKALVRAVQTVEI